MTEPPSPITMRFSRHTRRRESSRRWPCGGCVAASRARTAAGDAGDWISRREVARCGGPCAHFARASKIPATSSARTWGSKSPAERQRSTAGASRPNWLSSDCDRRDQHFFGAGGQGGNHHDPRRLPCRRRPGPPWSCRLARPGGNLTGINFFASQSWRQSGWSSCVSWCPGPLVLPCWSTG